jgi:hypothetical protein
MSETVQDIVASAQLCPLFGAAQPKKLNRRMFKRDKP